jgi:mannose-6-phosphate isomerase-like protein (cupin superfamily)
MKIQQTIKNTYQGLVPLVLALPILAANAENTTQASNSYRLPLVKPDPNPLQILTPANEIFTFIKVGATTCHRYTMVEALIPPGAGPLPHIHHFTDEWFYFPKGGITLQMSMQASPNLNIVPGINAPKQMLHQVQTSNDSLFYGARYYMHGYINTTNKPLKVITIWTPDDAKVGISNYFREVGQRIINGKIPAVNPNNKALFVSQAPKYGINQSSSFNQYVAGVDNDFPNHTDNRAAELDALLRNTTPCSTTSAVPQAPGIGGAFPKTSHPNAQTLRP